MSLPRYPTYKDSGIEWLGELPCEWEVIKLSQRLKRTPCYGVLVPDYVDEGIPMLRINDIEDGVASRERLKNISSNLSEEYSRTVLEEGDIALAVVGTIGRSLIVGRELVGCNLSRAVARVTPDRGLTSQMLHWIFESLCFKYYTDLTCVGTAQRVLNMNSLSSFSITLPDIESQICIDKFLSRETAKIDALISEQQRLIELLQEKQQAVISHAVTKGLNPDTPMKDSGVEWLGEVPEHWRTTRLGHHAKAKGGAGFPDEYQGSTEEELAFLKVANLGNNDSLANTDGYEHTISKETALKLRAEVHKRGSVVFAKVGAALLLERYKFLAQDSCIDNNMMVIVNDEKFISNNFLRHSLSTVRLKMIVNPGAVPSINAAQVHNLELTFPPLHEQDDICKYIKEKTAKIDDLVRQSKASIELLKERRSALISAAVTGQIDVRGLSSQEKAA